MTYKEIKEFCDNKINEFPELSERYKKEIIYLKRFEKNGRDIYKEFEENREKIDNRYTIPFILGFTNEVDLSKPLEMVQVKPGASGGIDIDTDFQPSGKDFATEYLKNKYGEDKVISVGTFTRMGVSSAAKDLLRIYEVPFKESNEFTKELDSQESWEKNIERLKNTRPELYNFYLKYKDVLDITPSFVNKVRQSGKHAGGVVVLDRPVYELAPVDRVSGNIVTAFEESGASQILDEIGIVKLDLLGISILDVISSAIESIDEELVMIEDDDGIVKIVPESYMKENIQKEENE